MYKITIQTLSSNEKTLYYPGSEEYVVSSAVLSLRVGSAGEFNFTVPLDNPFYAEIVDHAIISVYEDNLEIWRGDIRDIQQNFDKSLAVYCLEDLAWLGEEAVAMTSITNETYLQRFTGAIASYNQNQVAKRQFTQGMLTSVTTSSICKWQPKYEENLLDCLRNYIADDGYVRIRRTIVNGSLVRYVDIIKLSDYGQQATQAIEFGQNLLDFVKEMDDTNFLNVLYPYGAETDTELYGDIMQRIVGTPIQNDVSVAAFGRRARSVVFETDSEAKLNSLALAYLNRYSQPNMKIRVRAVDLGNIDLINRIHLGDSVRIIATTFGVDQWDYVTKQDLDLLDLSNNQIELSDTVRTTSLTSQVATQAQEIENIPTQASVIDAAKKNAMAILQGDNGGVVTFQVNGEEQIVGILIANNLDITQATKAWGWNINGLCYVHRQYPSDDWTLGIAMTMNGEIVADYITTGEMSADRINGGHIRANLITSLNGTTTVGGNTLSDFATKASTIVDVDVEYAKNQSSTTAPTSGWSTSSPQWEEGYYIWQRTKTTDGNNQASYSTPVCIQGAKGEKGDDGNSISSVTITYGSSGSPSTVPTTWYNNPPTVAQGDYLWTRTIIDYTDTSVQDTVSYTYSRQGENGQQGQAGTSVTVSSIQYQEGTSATSAPTGTWSNNPVTVAQGNYLWTKTTFSNGSIAYGIARQGEDGTDGTDGTDGSDGVGVSAIVEQYYLSTSDQSPTGGSWSTNQPAWEDGKYIWTRSHVTWTDSTTTDTAPVLAQAINGANEAVVDLDDKLDQEEVWKRLTDNSSDCIILQNGVLGIKATSIITGILADQAGKFSLNMTTGALTMNSGTFKGEINVNNMFTVDSSGNINAKAGTIGDLTLASGELYKNGTRVLLSDSVFYARNRTTDKTYTLLTFNTTALGVKGTASLQLRHWLIPTGQYTSPYVALQRKSGNSWYDVASIYVVYSTEWVDSYIDNINFNEDADYRVIMIVFANSGTFTLNYGLKLANATLVSLSGTGIAGQFRGTLSGLLDCQSGGKVGNFNVFENTLSTESEELDPALSTTDSSAHFSPERILIYDGDNDEGFLVLSGYQVELYKDSYYAYLRMEIQANNNRPRIYALANGTTYQVTFSSSDRRFKHDIEPLDTELSIKLIDGTETKSFVYNGDEGKHYGVIAQEARELLDSLGETDAMLEHSMGVDNPDVPDPRTIDYHEYIPHLINYVKELKSEINELKAELNKLKEEK